jgi:hypothetical protein
MDMSIRNTKRFRVSVNFPEISASHSYQDAEAAAETCASL